MENQGAWGTGGTPAQIADGRSGVRDAEKLADARGRDGTADGAVEREDNRVVLLCEQARRHGAEETDGDERKQQRAKRVLAKAVHRFLPDR